MQYPFQLSLSHVQLFVTPWTAAHQASLSFTISWNLLKLMFIESVMPSNHLILCCSLLLLPSIYPRIKVFSNELALHIRWPKYWSFSFSISLFNEYLGLFSFRGFPKGRLRQYSVCLQCRRPGFDPWVGKIPWRRKWQLTPVLTPRESHGWRSLVGYSPCGRRVGHN